MRRNKYLTSSVYNFTAPLILRHWSLCCPDGRVSPTGDISSWRALVYGAGVWRWHPGHVISVVTPATSDIGRHTVSTSPPCLSPTHLYHHHHQLSITMVSFVSYIQMTKVDRKNGKIKKTTIIFFQISWRSQDVWCCVDHVVCGPDIPKYVSLASVRWWAAAAGWEVTALDCRIWSPLDQDQGWFHHTTYLLFYENSCKSDEI